MYTSSHRSVNESTIVPEIDGYSYRCVINKAEAEECINIVTITAEQDPIPT